MNGIFKVTLFALIIPGIFIIAAGAGCSKKSSDPAYIPPGGLRPESELSHNLCNWPAQDFSPTNYVTVHLGLAAGTYAIDFTLKDTSGTDYTLCGLLATKPVLLVFGSYT